MAAQCSVLAVLVLTRSLFRVLVARSRPRTIYVTIRCFHHVTNRKHYLITIQNLPNCPTNYLTLQWQPETWGLLFSSFAVWKSDLKIRCLLCYGDRTKCQGRAKIYSEIFARASYIIVNDLNSITTKSNKYSITNIILLWILRVFAVILLTENEAAEIIILSEISSILECDCILFAFVQSIILPYFSWIRYHIFFCNLYNIIGIFIQHSSSC